MRLWRIAELCCAAFVLGISCGLSGCASSPSDDGGDDHLWPNPPAVIDVGPRWCPIDTARVAYTHYPKDWDEFLLFGGPTVWIVNLATGQKEFVTRGWVYYWWSDGTKLLCGGADEDIWFVDLATGKATMILHDSKPLGEADISPSDAKIAYVVDDLREGGIWVLSLGSFTKSRVCRGRGPSWHPSSSEILCDGLVIVGEDGTRAGAIPYPDTIVSPQQCCWHPDGRVVAFTAFREWGGDERIYVVGVNGSDLRMVAEDAQGPTWSPDGSRIAYSGLTDDGKAAVLWAVNSDGTGRTQITFP